MGLSSLNVHDNDLWDQMLQLPSFSKKGALVKLARWFGWNEVCNEMLAEYHAFKMVLEDSLDLDDESNPSSVLPNSVPTAQGPSMNDPTSQGLLNAAATRKEISPKEELSLMKTTTGGFKLAWKLMTEDLYYPSHILLEVTRPLWSWYAAEIQSVKSLQDSVKRSAQWRWVAGRSPSICRRQ